MSTFHRQGVLQAVPTGAPGKGTGLPQTQHCLNKALKTKVDLRITTVGLQHRYVISLSSGFCLSERSPKVQKTRFCPFGHCVQVGKQTHGGPSRLPRVVRAVWWQKRSPGRLGASLGCPWAAPARRSRPAPASAPPRGARAEAPSQAPAQPAVIQTGHKPDRQPADHGGLPTRETSRPHRSPPGAPTPPRNRQVLPPPPPPPLPTGTERSRSPAAGGAAPREHGGRPRRRLRALPGAGETPLPLAA